MMELLAEHYQGFDVASSSFPRSAWECRPRRSASSAIQPCRSEEDAERPGRHSHAERGNECKIGGGVRRGVSK
jgi:hypothetical protein